jgi:hypothetical protein
MTRRPKRQGLFVGFWFDLDGRKLRKVRKSELAEAYRLIAKHKDVRSGSLSARPQFSDDPEQRV